MVKTPIDKNGKGNCCPKCGSKKVSVHMQYPLFVEEDLNTGKEILHDLSTGKRLYNPTIRELALRYKLAKSDAQCWSYKCRKCDWASEMFIP